MLLYKMTSVFYQQIILSLTKDANIEVHLLSFQNVTAADDLIHVHHDCFWNEYDLHSDTDETK